MLFFDFKRRKLPKDRSSAGKFNHKKTNVNHTINGSRELLLNHGKLLYNSSIIEGELNDNSLSEWEIVFP